MRGQATFAADAMLRALPAPGSTGGPWLEPALADYRAFYSLPGPDANCSHHIACIDTAGYRIAVQTFTPEVVEHTALVVHGYYDHVGIYGHLIEYLLSRRCRVIAYDQPGHGLSGGRRAWIDDFSTYVNVLRDVLDRIVAPHNEPVSVFGQSMGGSVVMEDVVRFGRDPFKNVVVFAPLVRPHAWWYNRFVFALARLVIDERPRDVTDNAENPEFIALQHIDPLQPRVLPVDWVAAMVRWMKPFSAADTRHGRLSVIQGDADTTVDYRFNLKVVERRFDADILHFAKGRHHLVNESADLRAAMWTWIDEQCAFS